MTIEFLDSTAKPIKKFSSKDKEHAPAIAAGLNRFSWDMRYPDSTSFPGMIYWAANSRGPIAVPGMYSVKLTVDGKPFSQPFEIRKDPRMAGTIPDLQKQFDLSLQLRDKVTQTNDV